MPDIKRIIYTEISLCSCLYFTDRLLGSEKQLICRIEIHLFSFGHMTDSWKQNCVQNNSYDCAFWLMIDIISKYPEFRTARQKDTADFFRRCSGLAVKDTWSEQTALVPNHRCFKMSNPIMLQAGFSRDQTLTWNVMCTVFIRECPWVHTCGRETEEAELSEVVKLKCCTRNSLSWPQGVLEH